MTAVCAEVYYFLRLDKLLMVNRWLLSLYKEYPLKYLPNYLFGEVWFCNDICSDSVLNSSVSHDLLYLHMIILFIPG